MAEVLVSPGNGLADDGAGRRQPRGAPHTEPVEGCSIGTEVKETAGQDGFARVRHEGVVEKKLVQDVGRVEQPRVLVWPQEGITEDGQLSEADRSLHVPHHHQVLPFRHQLFNAICMTDDEILQFQQMPRFGIPSRRLPQGLLLADGVDLPEQQGCPNKIAMMKGEGEVEAKGLIPLVLVFEDQVREEELQELGSVMANGKAQQAVHGDFLVIQRITLQPLGDEVQTILGYISDDLGKVSEIFAGNLVESR